MHAAPAASIALLASIMVAAPALPAPVLPESAQEAAVDPQTLVYELRIYHPAPGKLAALSARFRNHTLGLFAKHGMRNIAYWNEQPTAAAPEGRIVYVLAYPSRAAREASWQAFGTDPAWRAVATASEANGKLVAKVDSVFMTMADYSPALTLPR